MARKDKKSRDWARFDRADQIATTILLWLLIGFSAGYAVFISLDWFLRRQVTLRGVELEVSEDAAGTGRVVGQPEGNVLVDEVSTGHFLLLMVPVLLWVGALVWGGVLVSRLLRDLGQGEPFARSNWRRLVILALLLMVTPVTVSMVEAIARAEILRARGVEAFYFTFSFEPFIVGLLVAAVATAFAAGSRLRADVDGLV